MRFESWEILGWSWFLAMKVWRLSAHFPMMKISQMKKTSCFLYQPHDWSEHWPFKTTKSSEEPYWSHAFALGQYSYGKFGIRMLLLYIPCWTNFMAEIMVKVVNWRTWKPWPFWFANVYHDHESGLKMVYNRETGQDISEDKEGFNHEGVDSDEEEDVEESSDEENDKSCGGDKEMLTPCTDFKYIISI